MVLHCAHVVVLAQHMLMQGFVLLSKCLKLYLEGLSFICAVIFEPLKYQVILVGLSNLVILNERHDLVLRFV